jgi:hypothetical protein
MKRGTSAHVWLAGTLAIGLAAFAEVGAQQPAQPQAQPGARSSADQQITVTGCIQREADYRRARDAGKGGVAGTGVGAGNEFVLTDASSSSSSAGAGATGTAGSTGSNAYELTGPNEGSVSQYVGKRVEITGKLKPAETDAAGRPTGGATAGKPPEGVDVTSKDLKLRELEVTSLRESTGTCPTSK